MAHRPCEFLEVERHLAELNAHPPVPGENDFWLIWNSDVDAYQESQFPLPAAPQGPSYELTETDKQEIISDVLSALPTYSGEVETV